MDKDKLTVVCYGLGPIGRAAARLALSRKRLKVVGAVDVDPEIVGRDLGLVCGLPSPALVDVTDDPVRLLAGKRVDVVLHATGSRFAKVYDQLAEIAGNGASVVSSCEELLFPWISDAEKAESLDKLAASAGAVVVGTGVNPGFVLDTLAICLSGACDGVRRIEGHRVVDAATRRAPLLAKIGAGIEVAEFQRLKEERRIGHVGLIESLALVADATGIARTRGPIDFQETLEPVVARTRVQAADLVVEPGRVAGVHQIAMGSAGGAEVLRLDLAMFVGAEDPHDEIRIDAVPPIHARIHGGVAGDQATAAILVNLLPLARAARPGLRTMADLPVPRYTG
ncbi:MAG: dihydrodipicolinate reductase [Planctomycetes bacterium]|nr:dihydrodipicolinate reductase [Planctomycetota bacterium]